MTTLADAVKKYADRQADTAEGVVQLATVVATSPLTIRLTASGVDLFEDELRYARNADATMFSLTQTIVLMRANRDGEIVWVVLDVFSGDDGETPTPPGIVTNEQYHHIQGSPSALWVVIHNLNRYANVKVVSSGGVEVYGAVTYNSLNQLTIAFSAGFSGDAYLD